MSPVVVLPALGESVSEGTVTRWLKRVGDSVEVGEPLVEVSTDKVDTEVVSTAAGIIDSLLVAEDETVDIGTAIAIVADADPEPGGLDLGAIEPVPVEPVTVSTDADLQSAPMAPVKNDAVANRRYVTPLVRRLVAEHGLDPMTVTGTGIDGRVRRDDVLEIVRLRTESSTPSPAVSPSSPITSSLRGTTVPLSRLRRVLASRAVESLSSTAQLTTVVEVDVTRVDRLRRAHGDSFRQRTGLSLRFLPFFAVAATEALREFPIINARIEGESLVYPDVENVNIAVDTESGLYSPVIRDAGAIGIEGFARAIEDLAVRAREGRLAPDDLSSGTFTITNTGSRGALFDTPVVFLPQVAILGTGVVTRRPVVLTRDGEEFIAVRSMVYLALSYDHRAVDGADAARYLSAVKQRLEAADFTIE